MYIKNDIKYIGVNDHKIDLFEGQFIVPDGMAYNSYVILDEKIAVFDTVDANFGDEWLNSLETELNGRKPDYLIIQHVELDHSANIITFMNKYADAVIVASSKAFPMIKQFYGSDFSDRRIEVKEGDSLSLGKHCLNFVMAPMVHWPEVMVTYESTDKVLFSADGFGKFGALDVEADWDCEARRYYFGIVAPYGAPVQALLKKASVLEITAICPLHGPVITENIAHYVDKYQIWSKYDAENKGVMIAYTSVYGNTKKAALLLADKLEKLGCPRVAVADLARDDMVEAIEDSFRHSNLVLATTTYNTSIFPFMHTFITELCEKKYQKRTVGIIENGSWAPTAAKIIKEKLSACKDITVIEPVVTIKSALNEDSMAKLDELAEAIIKSIN